jgi:hypothetical protein
MSYLNVNQISTAAGAPSFTTAAGGININGNVLGAGNSSTMKNRIINGAMVISQRGTSSVTTALNGGNTYVSCDRWAYQASQASKFSIQQNAGSITPPVGFTNYLGVTSLSAYTVTSGDYFNIIQSIEGYNVADLAYGTASAKTITLSFWIYSSLTGSFGGALSNNSANRSYPFLYTVSSANTWTQVSITIPGDTTGTWLTNNGNGMYVFFGLGMGSGASGTAGSWQAGNYQSATGATSVVGTNGATFYITGVQLEVGSSATGYEYRQYGTELALCQRYYVKIGGNFLYDCIFIGFYTDSVTFFVSYPLPVTMRTTPTVASNALYVDNGAGGGAVTALSVIANQTNPQIGYISATTTNGTLGRSANMRGNNSTSNYLSYSAEL